MATPSARATIREVVTLFAVAAVVAAAVLLVTSTHSGTTGVRLRVLSSSLYGKVLVVGSGSLSGFPLYEFSGDVAGHLGCGVARALGSDVGTVANVKMTCTGPMRDLTDSVASDDWPALTTSGRPVAGKGVDPALLGTVRRAGIGDQVTYGGHPLYLFDTPSAPFAPQGVDYVETVHPFAPWHGVWFLVSARDGAPVGGPARLEVGRLPSGRPTLTVSADVNVYRLQFDVYEYSADTPGRVACSGACNATWIPVVTTGAPVAGAGVSAGELGSVARGDGARQVTYRGHPLYLYAREQVSVVGHRTLARGASVGNGDHLRWGAGEFTLVSPSS